MEQYSLDESINTSMISEKNKVMVHLKQCHIPAVVWSVLLCLVMWLAIGSIAPVSAMEPRPHCKVCRRFTDKSPASMQLAYRFNKRVVSYKVCSAFCYFEFIEDYTEHEAESIRVVNFNSLEWEFVLFANAINAHYLYGIDGDEQQTHEPYTAAFQSETEAKKAQEALGGELMDWDELAKLVSEITDEYEPETPGSTHKPNKRKGR